MTIMALLRCLHGFGCKCNKIGKDAFLTGKCRKRYLLQLIVNGKAKVKV
jgi:hypothetical protein